MTVVRARRAWLPGGVQTGVAIELADDGTIRDVRPATSGDGPAIDGLVVPAFVNAHTHLELSHLHRRVPGGHGFLPWLDGLRRAEGADPALAGTAAARRLAATGTAWVLDVSNGGHTAPWLRDAGLRGVVHHELLGMDAQDVPARVEVAASYAGADADADVVVRPSPHALFSTAPELVVAAVRGGPPGVPATIHVGEAEDEARFLEDATGPLAALLDALGRDWRRFVPPGTGPVAYLDALGVLGPGLLLVHGVRLTPDEIRLAAARGAPVCFCPRSNLHIGGRLPDVPTWIAAGARCALGTDALASNDDLDVLQEIPALARAYPAIPSARWLAMVTHEGAAAVGARRVGRLERGARPGLVLLDVGGPDDVARGRVDRSWLFRPQGT